MMLRYVKCRWPEDVVPAGEPMWLLYEIDEAADAVTRSVWIYVDGSVTRNSIEIEERNGKACPSLIDCSVTEGFADADLELLTVSAFQEAWARGVDTPFWNVG